MALFADTADLEPRIKEQTLAELFSEANPRIWDATAKATAEEYLDRASKAIQRRVRGFIDTSDSEVQDELKGYCCDWALWLRYGDRGNGFGPTNPYHEPRKEAVKSLELIRTGKERLTEDNVPMPEAFSSTADTNPEFCRAADGGGGSDSSILDDF